MSRRRNSIVVDDYIPNINLNRAEQLELQASFKKAHPVNGGITFYDMINILKNSYRVGEKERSVLLKDIQFKQIKTLDSNTLVWAASTLKKMYEETEGKKTVQENQYYDAFVALGGNIDKSGFVSRNTLMKTIVDEFGIALDSNSQIPGFQGFEQQKLNYDEFCDLFKTRQNLKKQQNPQENATRGRTQTMKSLQIDEQAFNEYLAHLNDQDDD